MSTLGLYDTIVHRSEAGTRRTRSSPQRQRFDIVAAWILASLAACTGPDTESGPPQNVACAIETELPAGDERCFGAIDVEYRYANPARTVTSTAPETAALPWDDSYYVQQTHENNCYAATLSMAYRMFGEYYNPDSFSNAISNECFGTGHAPLTFSQILFAATKVDLPNGVWYIDAPDSRFSQFFNAISDETSGSAQQSNASWSTNKVSWRKNWSCQSPYGYGISSGYYEAHIDVGALLRILGLPPLTIQSATPKNTQNITALTLGPGALYGPITWHHNGPRGGPIGFIAPIHDTTDLVNRVYNGAPVLAGLRSGQFGHVVLVRAIKYFPGGPETRIDSVEVVDPARPDVRVYGMEGDDFINGVSFMFALYE
jgi:hypothetical protein